jgi:hypothetical protein
MNIRAFAALLALSLGFVVGAPPIGHAQVKPGEHIGAANASLVRNLVSPGAYIAVTKGMEMNIVAPGRVLWPPP